MHVLSQIKICMNEKKGIRVSLKYHFGLGENDFLAFNAQLFKDRVNEMKFENLLRVF